MTIGTSLLAIGGTLQLIWYPLITEDWSKLFHLLEAGQIKPIIAAKFPVLEAAKANDLLASGSVVGNVVLLAPDLL